MPRTRSLATIIPRALKATTVRQARARAEWLIKRTENPDFARDSRDNHALKLLLAFLLNPDDSCVDVGAHTGDMLQLMQQYAPEGTHVAFEPIPKLAEQLATDFPTAVVHHAAVLDHSGDVSFLYAPEAPAYSGLRRRNYPVEVRPQEITVPGVTLDEALPGALTPRLIKIDVEGGELGVLRGAQRTIERHRPVVVFEHGKGAADQYGTTPSDVFDFLDGVGYRLFNMDGEPYTRARLEHSFETKDYFNFVAHQ